MKIELIKNPNEILISINKMSISIFTELGYEF